MPVIRALSAGDFPNEQAAADAFDRLIEASCAFRVYREVEGYYVAQKPGRELKKPRIDRILEPLPATRDAGWEVAIGVEIKCSGLKLGPAVNQAIDYTWGVFRVGATWLYPEAVFIWPAKRAGDGEQEGVFGAIESVMVQNRIGTCAPSHDGKEAVFQLGATHVLHAGHGGLTLHRQDVLGVAGRKQGSR